VIGLETVLGPETKLIEVYSLTNTSIMQASYFWVVVWNISVSSDVLRTFEFPNFLKLKPGLNMAGVLDVLQPESGNLSFSKVV
jgi:hypothetical protein